MKKCKYCQSDIDEKANICPNCRKKQGIPIVKIILIVLFVLLLASCMFSEEEEVEHQTGTTETKEDISLLDGHTGKAESKYSYEITGTLKNNTNDDYSYVQVEFYAYDKDGNMLDTCLGNNSGLEANGTWKFTASCFFSDGNAKDVVSYKLQDITSW